MKRLPKEVFSYLSSVDKVKYLKDYIQIESNNEIFICKEKIPKEVINYLESIHFKQYYKKINQEEDFDLIKIDDELYGDNPLVDLYQKSIEEEEISQELKENIYNNLSKNYEEKFLYYMKLQDQIEEQMIIDKNNYKLLINMSKIYQFLSLGRYFLEEWFYTQKEVYHKTLWINDMSENNIINNKIIMIDSLKKDYLVFSIANYYQEKTKEDILYNFKLYNYEKYLLLSMIAIPSSNNSMDLLNYINKTISILLEEYKENQKSKEEMS